MKTKLLIPLLLLLTVGAAAQTSQKEMFRDLNRTGAIYFIYPGPAQKVLTPAPAGYEPFYISHYGRHGSRYMEDNSYYEYAIHQLDTAAQLGILTAKGADVLARLRIGYADAKKREGDLTPLGARQHREIAHRMYERFPELLSQPIYVDARSSTALRCMTSMFSFCNELQGLNPTLYIRMDASERDMDFVVGNRHVQIEDSPEMAELEKRVEALSKKAFTTSRLMKSLFTDISRAESFIEPMDLVGSLYNVASDLQNVPELGLSLMDVFTKEELFGIWKMFNASVLVQLGLVPGSTPNYLMQKEVRDSIVSFADRAIRSGEPSLSLRFSHDGCVLSLTYLMGLKEAMGGRKDIDNLYKYISIDKLIPMAANIQIVFYRKEGSDDVLVKFLLNENETTLPDVSTSIAPYYHWADVKHYWEGHPLR